MMRKVKVVIEVDSDDEQMELAFTSLNKDEA